MSLAIVNPGADGLDAGNAYWMARLAQAAYQRRADADPYPNEAAILANLQAEDPNFLSVSGVCDGISQAMLVEHRDYLTLVFRGTDQPVDWLTNANLRTRATEYGDFHHGFYLAATAIWEPLKSLLRDAQMRQNRPLFLTGHSLGGAMATVTAARLYSSAVPFVAVYTFGQPMATAASSADRLRSAFGKRMFRFQMNHDLVTRVPPPRVGFRHVGRKVYISGHGTLHVESGRWFRALDQVIGLVDLARNRNLTLISDHDMGLYLQAVSRWDFRG